MRTIIQRLAQAAAGAVNVLMSVKPALLLSPVHTLTHATPAVHAGIAVAETDHRLVADEKPAFAVAMPTISGTLASPAVNPAPALALVLTNVPIMTKVPSFEITRFTDTLTHRKGGVTAATTGAWTTATNAQGDHNGTPFATCAGSIGGATFTLNLDYTDMVSKAASLTLDAVKGFFYSRVTGDTAGLLCTVTFERSLDNGGAWTTIGTQAGNYDDLTTPRSFTLSPVPSWAQVDAVRYRVSVAMAAASVGVSFALDAIELQVEASMVQAL